MLWILRVLDVSCVVFGLLFSFPFWFLSAFYSHDDYLKKLRIYRMAVFATLAIFQTVVTGILIQLYKSKLR